MPTRQLPVGRKNWLFFQTEGGGETAVVLLSLVMTAKGVGIDPRTYLQDVMLGVMPVERLSKEIKRRTRVATLFPMKHLLRLVTAILSEVSEEWETGRIYLHIEDRFDSLKLQTNCCSIVSESLFSQIGDAAPECRFN